MAYLGRGIENLSDRVVLDSLTASATASYTLQLNSVNFVPSSSSSLTVSLNGVIQKPDSSYTVSGSTLTFSSALTSSDSIDFIIAERGITLQTPSAGSVGTSQLANGAVTLAKTDGNFGKVLQVVENSSTTTLTNSTTTVSEMLNASITPSSTSNKIFIIGTANLDAQSNGNTYSEIQVFRGTLSGTGLGAVATGRSGSGAYLANLNAIHLDSPNTTSAQQYTLGFRKASGSTTSTSTDGRFYSLILMEIAG